MKVENIVRKLRLKGFDNINIYKNFVKVNIGFMSNDYEDDYVTKQAKFEDLKGQLLIFCSIHSLYGKREGGAFIIYGK